MLNLNPYLIGAALVGMLHMSAPDHWVTVLMMGRNLRWTRARIFGVSLATASGHVVLSVILGLGVVLVGIVFSRLISLYLDLGIGAIMVVVGLVVGIKSLLSWSREGHDGREKAEAPEAGRLARSISYFAVLGAALSPDLSITPIFLAAIPAGFYFALELSLVFAAASVLTLLLLVQLGSAGLVRALERVPEKYNDALVGFVIAVVGLYILATG